MSRAFCVVAIAAVAWVLAAPVATAQSVPGHKVEVYAGVTDPTSISLANDGTLFTGRDLSGSGGGSGDPCKIWRIGVGGSPVREYGVEAIADPDGVIVDNAGSVTGIPGAVLVAHWAAGWYGEITVVRPDETVYSLTGVTDVFYNPDYMALDKNGDLLVKDYTRDGQTGYVVRVSNGVPTRLFSTSILGDIAVSPSGDIFTIGVDGVVQVFSTEGQLLNGNFAQIPASPVTTIEFGAGGPFGTDLYASTYVGGLYRIDALGAVTQIGDGFQAYELAFGPDGLMYVSDFGKDRILRIAPESWTPPDFLNPGWNWFSLPAIPTDSAVMSIFGSYDPENRLYRWDSVNKNIELYPDDFTTLDADQSYVLLLDRTIGISVTGGPAPPGYAITLGAAGWTWIGFPKAEAVPLAGVVVRNQTTGEIRTAAEDFAEQDGWINWNWLYWDSTYDTARILGLSGADDDHCRPWYGYRLWANISNIDIIYPEP